MRRLQYPKADIEKAPGTCRTIKITCSPDSCHPASFCGRAILHLFLKKAPGVMKIVFLLILFSLLLAAGFLLVYLWAARNGQFDDDYTPAIRILFDDPAPDPTLPDTGQSPPKASTDPMPNDE